MADEPRTELQALEDRLTGLVQGLSVELREEMRGARDDVLEEVRAVRRGVEKLGDILLAPHERSEVRSVMQIRKVGG